MLREEDIEQAWLEIKDTFGDTLLNMQQKKQFVIAILKGQLANPEDPENSDISQKLISCICGHDINTHNGHENINDRSCFYSYNCGCKAFDPQ